MTHRLTTAPWVPLLAVLALAGCNDSTPPERAPQLLAISATASAGGTITPGSVKAPRGSKARFMLTPDTNYLIDNVSGCGAGVLLNNTYTTAPLTTACTVTATFRPSYALGGTVSGLSGGASVLLGNNTDEVRVSASGAFAFPRRLGAGDDYAVKVLEQPAGLDCTLSNAVGAMGAADIRNIAVSCAPAVTPLYPLKGANWNDYVANDGPSPLQATDTACVSHTPGGPSACVHGGERRAYEVPALASSAGLTATDALKAFDWSCDIRKGYVRFVSRLKDDTRVADLIDFDEARWQDNKVTVLNGSTEVAASELRKWWSNPLVIKNSGLNAPDARVAGTLYLISQDAKGMYTLDASKTGLIIREGVTLIGTVSVFRNDFIWIEGDINAQGQTYGINMLSPHFSVLRHIRAANAISRGIFLANAANNRLSHLLLSNNEIGLYLVESNDNTIIGVTAANNEYGLMQAIGKDNLLARLTLTNNNISGYYLDRVTQNILAGLIATGNGTSGIYANTVSDSTFADTALAHNYQGINLVKSSGNRFTGRLMVGGSSSNCAVVNGTLPGLINTSCSNEGASDAALTTNISLATSFIGKVTTDDAASASDSNGTAAYPGEPANFDWFQLAHSFRVWGRDGSVFPNSDNRGRWASGTGRIWDWSLAAPDTIVRNALARPGGNDVITHTWSGGGSATFLRRAVELDGDGDGLCESNETCLYTPNLGAYQGHGELVSAGTFSNGTVTGVRLLRYASNGR